MNQKSNPQPKRSYTPGAIYPAPMLPQTAGICGGIPPPTRPPEPLLWRHVLQTLCSKVRRKCEPSSRNAYTGRESTYGRETCQKCNPFARNATRNSTPSSEIASVRAVLGGAGNCTPSHEIASKVRPLKQKCIVKSAKISPLH